MGGREPTQTQREQTPHSKVPGFKPTTSLPWGSRATCFLSWKKHFLFDCRVIYFHQTDAQESTLRHLKKNTYCIITVTRHYKSKKVLLVFAWFPLVPIDHIPPQQTPGASSLWKDSDPPNMSNLRHLFLLCDYSVVGVVHEGKAKKHLCLYAWFSLTPSVDQSVNRPGGGSHRERETFTEWWMQCGPSHNAVRSADKGFIVIPGFGSGIVMLSLTACHQAPGEEDTLTTMSLMWRIATCAATSRRLFHTSAYFTQSHKMFLCSVLSDNFPIHTYYTVAWDPICPSNIVRWLVRGIDLKREILHQAGNKLLFT